MSENKVICVRKYIHFLFHALSNFTNLLLIRITKKSHLVVQKNFNEENNAKLWPNPTTQTNVKSYPSTVFKIL